MFLETFSTLSMLREGPPVQGDLDRIAGQLEELNREMEKEAHVKKRRKRPTEFNDTRYGIPTGIVQEELLRRRKLEMRERAEFNARFMAAVNEMYKA